MWQLPVQRQRLLRQLHQLHRPHQRQQQKLKLGRKSGMMRETPAGTASLLVRSELSCRKRCKTCAQPKGLLGKYIDKYGKWQLEKKDLKRKTQHQYYVTPKRSRKCVSFRKLTVAGGYLLAIKRSFGHTGATASTGHLELDLTRQRTVAWEHLLVANLVAQVQAFFANAYRFLRWGHRRLTEEWAAGTRRARELLKVRNFSYEIHVMRADGTHTHQAEGAKAHSMEVRSVINFSKCLDYALALTDEELDNFELDYCPGEYVVDITCFPDIVKVPEPCDGAVSRHLFLKQLTSLGIRAWNRPVLEDTPTLGFNQQTIGTFDADTCMFFHVGLYLFGTDNGGDQQGCDVAIDLDFELEQLKIKFRNWCFLHQLHLIVKRQLEKLGKKYFSTLAKVIHIWRAGQNHKKLKEICEAMTLSTNPGLAATAFR